MKRVGLVGTGPRSEIVAHLLDRSGTEIHLWSDRSIPDAFPDTTRAVEMVDLTEASLIFVCLPLHRLRDTVRDLGAKLDGRHVLVHTTRSHEYSTLTPISTVFEEETPTRRFGFVTGPMRRHDVLEDRGASAVCASPFPEVVDMVEEALTSRKFRVYRNEDLVGAEAAASYARVIALAYGMGAELGLGDSILATLFARGLDEMSKFVTYQGGYENTTFGLAGAGNLHADTTGEGNVDFDIGRRYVAAGAPKLEKFRDELDVIEDELFDFLRSLVAQAKRGHLEYHILHALERALFQEKGVETAFDWLMELPNLSE